MAELGFFVIGIDQSYRRSVYEVVREVKVDGKKWYVIVFRSLSVHFRDEPGRRKPLVYVVPANRYRKVSEKYAKSRGVKVDFRYANSINSKIDRWSKYRKSIKIGQEFVALETHEDENKTLIIRPISAEVEPYNWFQYLYFRTYYCLVGEFGSKEVYRDALHKRIEDILIERRMSCNPQRWFVDE